MDPVAKAAQVAEAEGVLGRPLDEVLASEAWVPMDEEPTPADSDSGDDWEVVDGSSGGSSGGGGGADDSHLDLPNPLYLATQKSCGGAQCIADYVAKNWDTPHAGLPSPAWVAPLPGPLLTGSPARSAHQDQQYHRPRR